MRAGVMAVALATAFTLVAPAAAQAITLSTTVVVGSKLFPSGTAAPGGLAGAIPVLKGSSVTLWAPAYLYKPAIPPATMGSVYEFMFWDVNSILITTEKAKFTAPTAAAAFRATAWYLPICVDPLACTGVGTPTVTTWAFSLTNYKVLPGTPIGSVSPASGWTSPGTSVSTATAVDIAASSCIGVCSTSSWTVFTLWFVFGKPTTVTTSGLDLKVPAGLSLYAIAFYRQGTHTPIPKSPCSGYPC
jgi:hypothetical protein